MTNCWLNIKNLFRYAVSVLSHLLRTLQPDFFTIWSVVFSRWISFHYKFPTLMRNAMSFATDSSPTRRTKIRRAVVNREYRTKPVSEITSTVTVSPEAKRSASHVVSFEEDPPNEYLHVCGMALVNFDQMGRRNHAFAIRWLTKPGEIEERLLVRTPGSTRLALCGDFQNA